MPAFVLANLIITNPGIYMKYEAGFQNAFVDNQGKPFGQFLIVQVQMLAWLSLLVCRHVIYIYIYICYKL